MILAFLVKHAGLIGLIIFFGFFIIMAGWVYRPGAKKNFQKNASIPLQETVND